MDILINKARTCAFSGHRVLENNFDINNIKKIINKLINEGFDTFLIGMAIGFDTLICKILIQLKKEKDIKIVACIPCPEQSVKYNEYQKKEYDELLKSVDEKIVLSNSYTKYCMMKRNKFMVDNASVLISYLRHNYGGTNATVNYAVSKKISVIKV